MIQTDTQSEITKPQRDQCAIVGFTPLFRSNADNEEKETNLEVDNINKLFIYLIAMEYHQHALINFAYYAEELKRGHYVVCILVI